MKATTEVRFVRDINADEDTVTETSEDDLPIGTSVLNRYTILGKLTQGGMAEVYLARQEGPAGYTKLIVIKRVRPHLASDPDFVAMFVNEARLAARINHPNVVQIFDLGQGGPSGKDWFLAMEFLDGRDMLQVGRACRSHNKAVPFDVTARIIADACLGLEHAHQLNGADGKPLNLVHRDMSPENILITFEGQVKVLDFGIAKARDNAFRTQAGQIKGKLGYVAPEAILGKTLDGRADIFAIGATLYLFLCGRPAFSGSNPMEIFEKSLEPPTAPRAVNSRVPEALDAICMRCLAQKPEDRFNSCGELRQALDAYLTDTGRPLGAPQLAQFMRILFPPQEDPQRLRVDDLIASAPASKDDAPAAPAAAPIPREVTMENDVSVMSEDIESTQVVPADRSPASQLPTEAPDEPSMVYDGSPEATVEIDAALMSEIEASGLRPPVAKPKERNTFDDVDATREAFDVDIPIDFDDDADLPPPPIGSEEDAPTAIDVAAVSDPPPPAAAPAPGLTRNPALDVPSATLDAAAAPAQDVMNAGPQATEAYPLDVAQVTKAPTPPPKSGASGAARAASFVLGMAVGSTLLLGGLFSAELLGPVVKNAGLDIDVPPPPWAAPEAAAIPDAKPSPAKAAADDAAKATKTPSADSPAGANADEAATVGAADSAAANDAAANDAPATDEANAAPKAAADDGAAGAAKTDGEDAP